MEYHLLKRLGMLETSLVCNENGNLCNYDDKHVYLHVRDDVLVRTTMEFWIDFMEPIML